MYGRLCGCECSVRAIDAFIDILHLRALGFNVQTAVDAENYLIVAREVAMLGYDWGA
tara:strand:+ start:1647 stop:1817 length:171 start_codon:yes stop_codon:yes gene_type:complete